MAGPTAPWQPPASSRKPLVAVGLGAAVVAALLLAAVLAVPTATGREPARPAATGLVARLQDGGLAIYVRHAAREEVPEEVTDPADCSQQANLTEYGRQQAQALGQALSSLGISADWLYASPYCRTLQTAQLAFGEPVPVPALSGASLVPPVDPDAQRAALEQLLSTTPPSGVNTVIVGHGEVVEAVTGQPGPDFAGAIVFQPTGSSYAPVAAVSYEQIVRWLQSCPPDCS